MAKKANKRQLQKGQNNVQKDNETTKIKKFISNANDPTIPLKNEKKKSISNNITKHSNSADKLKIKKNIIKLENELNEIKANGHTQIFKKSSEKTNDLSKNNKSKRQIQNITAIENDSHDVQHSKKKLKKMQEAKKILNSSNSTNSVDISEKKITKIKHENRITKKRNITKENRKLLRKTEGNFAVLNKLSFDEMKAKIVEIEGRDTLTKTAIRKLRILRKKVQVAEEAADDTQDSKKHLIKKPEKVFGEIKFQNNSSNTKKDSNNENKDLLKECKKLFKLSKNKKQVQSTIANMQNSPTEKKSYNVIETIGNNKKEQKLETISENECDDEDETKSEDDESEDLNKELSVDVKETNLDEIEVKDTNSEKLQVNNSGSKNKNKNNTKDLKTQKLDKTNEKNSSNKNQRYVLFVGNLCHETTTVDLKKHFLSKVSKVKDVRIPLKQGTNEPRGFAYIEVENSTDYEKALSLHHTFIGSKQINVQYTTCNNKKPFNKQEIFHKSKKLHAIRKSGKLAGKHNFQKQNYKKQFNMLSKK